MKNDIKEADRNYLRKDHRIRLEVGIDRNGYPAFKPIFLENDKLVPGGRSVRIFRVAQGVERPKLTEGEEWHARIVAYKLKKEKTRDNREKIIFFLNSFKRIEQEARRLVDDKTGWVEIRSGSRLIRMEIVDLRMKKEEFIDAGSKQVIIVKTYFSHDGGLFHCSFLVYQMKKFAEQLRKLKIDPQNYIKKLPEFPKEKFDLL